MTICKLSEFTSSRGILSNIIASLSFSPAYIASGVELWSKHQEVKNQKALEKQSKEQMPLPVPKSPIPANSPGPVGAGPLGQPHPKFALGGYLERKQVGGV